MDLVTVDEGGEGLAETALEDAEQVAFLKEREKEVKVSEEMA